MKVCVNPQRSEWKELSIRPSSSNPIVRERVEKILSRVREGGDEALRSICSEIDGFVPSSFEVPAQTLRRAESTLSDELKSAIAAAASNIEAFHKAQQPREVKMETMPGVTCIQRPVPIRTVGLYIPGGTAPLFSTVLMLAIPARIAGCSEVVLCTPAGKDGKISPAVLYAASLCGVKRIFQLGGAQAIAAMAYGTASVPKVDKIFGPGNQYVTTAKQIVGGSDVAIDMPAGPSEVMVIADESSDPAFVASDLLSQAEHGRDSQVVLVCGSSSFAEKVNAEISRQLETLGRSELAFEALGKSLAAVLLSDDDVVDFAETYAPEHLIIECAEPWRIADRITRSGSVFVGSYTPESAGDYASGTNHTLPTCAWASSYSGVNLDSFMRKMTIQEISREGLENLSPVIVKMAVAEGLDAHANAAKIRLK